MEIKIKYIPVSEKAKSNFFKFFKFIFYSMILVFVCLLLYASYYYYGEYKKDQILKDYIANQPRIIDDFYWGMTKDYFLKNHVNLYAWKQEEYSEKLVTYNANGLDFYRTEELKKNKYNPILSIGFANDSLIVLIKLYPIDEKKVEKETFLKRVLKIKYGEPNKSKNGLMYWYTEHFDVKYSKYLDKMIEVSYTLKGFDTIFVKAKLDYELLGI